MTSNSIKRNLTYLFLLSFFIRPSFAQSNINLSQFIQCGDLVEIPEIVDNLSGITYNYTDDKLYAITNNPTRMYRLSMEGIVEVTYQLNGFTDTEGLTYMGNGTIAIAEEATNNIVFIQIPQGTSSFYSIAYPNTIIELDITTGFNKGIEGIAFDAGTNTMYVCQEKNPTILYSIQNPMSQIGSEITPTILFETIGGIIDMAGMVSYNGSLILLSEDSDRVVELDLGTKQIVSSLNNLIHVQAEGVTFNSQGELIVVGERNEFVKYRHSDISCNEALPDLYLTCGPLYVNGSQVTISDVRIYNIGEVVCPVSYVGYYLSEDNYITTDDIYIGRDYVKQLATGRLSLESFVFDSESLGLANGSYYVGAIADYQSLILEETESNNECYHSIQQVNIGVKSDLDATCGVLSYNSNNISISNVITTNNGPGKTGVSYTASFLSLDQEYSPDDILIDSEYIWSLNVGQSKVGNMSADLSKRQNIPSGNYYVLIVADFQSTEEESNELNNICIHTSQQINIANNQTSSDLVIDCGDVNISGDIVQFSNVSVTNIGSSPTSTYGFVGYYLSSTNSIPGNPSYKVGADYFPTLSVGSGSSESISVNLNNYSYIPPGSYYLGAKVDYSGRIAELNENNNICFSNQTVTISAFSDGTETRNFTESNDQESKLLYAMYPNPVLTGSSLIIELNKTDDKSDVQVFDANGKLVYSRLNSSQYRLTVNTSEMAAGLYYVKISNDSEVHTSKVILQ